VSSPPLLLLLLLLTALAAALAWALAGGLSRGLGRLGWLDQPNARSSHQRPTPRGGGLAFIVPACLLAPSPLLLIPLPLALVGLVDDRRGLPVRLRLVVQLLTGVTLALQAGWPLPLALPAAVLAAALINAINFMDGLDGLVASCLAIWLALAALLLSAPAPALLAAALLGFLAWNWSPARLFMGDVGSTYLGAVMAGVLLRAGHAGLGGAGWGALAALLLAALPLLADACSCLLRRLLAGQRLWQAHRLHLYQRLQQAGWSHGRVAGTYSGTTLGLAVLGFGVWGWNGALQLWALLTGVVLTMALGRLLERRWAVPFD
jgi:Fuc2NAc and GlcNAc transferase